MNLEEYQEKIENFQQNIYLKEHINEMTELFCDLTNQSSLSYYKYEYEYNEFFHQVTMNSKGEEIDFDNSGKKYKILLKDKKNVYGYFLISHRIKPSSIVKKLLKKIVIYLAKEKELRKKLFDNDIPFNIYLIHEDLDILATNLKSGLEGLFNVDVTIDTTIEKYFDKLRSKELKHIIIFLINDIDIFKNIEYQIRQLNEIIIVIGPNDHHISMHCGKMGIEDYISINDFKAENLKSIITNKRNTLLNKNKYGNKIIALSGISGGIGTTTIAMNMSNLISKQIPNRNLLYIDLSTTKAISNLFLGKNPLPDKTIIDLINTSEFNLAHNLENGLVKIRENFYAVTGIQKHIDAEYLEKDIFIEKLLQYISSCSDYFNFIIIDVGVADASNLKSTIYDIVNDLWIVTEMNLPHVAKLKTFYTLMKRAGLKDKVSFVANRYDATNAISLNDMTSILNMNNDEKEKFENFKLPNDYKSLGKCWNFCELVSDKDPDSPFVKKLNSILEGKNLYTLDRRKHEDDKKGFFTSLFSKDKK